MRPILLAAALRPILLAAAVRPILIAAALLAGLAEAQATAGLNCSAEDKSIRFSADAVLSRGAGEGFVSFRGELKVLAKAAPDDFRTVTLASEHLTQRWLHGNELKLRIYREREGKGPFGYLDLVLNTRGAGDEINYRGTYALTIYHLTPDDASEGKTIKARGRVSCSIG